MLGKQRGVSLGGLMVVLFVLVILGLLALKVIPPYMEFGNIKKAITAVSGGTSAPISGPHGARANRAGSKGSHPSGRRRSVRGPKRG